MNVYHKWKFKCVNKIAPIGPLPYPKNLPPSWANNTKKANNPHGVATLALGSRPRQRACKGMNQEETQELRQEEARESKQEEARESHHILPGVLESVRECEGVNTHTPKATPTLGDGVSVDSRNFRERLQGSKPMSYDVFYIIWKLLERRCLKWARIAHLDIWNISYGQKKGRESNCQFDSRPQKVGNRPDLLSFRGRATYPWKALDESYNFALDRTSIEGLLAKLWGSKIAGILAGGISGVPGKKSHLDVASVERCRVYYKGEGGGFPQVRVVVSLVCPCCPWLVLAPRVLQLCINHFVWVVCRPVWVSEACQLFLVPSWSSNTPLYPSKCCELGSVLWLLLLPLFYTWAHIWVF
jgi:hypothetical protein